MIYGWYNKKGEVITSLEYEKLAEDCEYKHIKKTYYSGVGAFVSTMWLGRNYGNGGRKPLIFETMVISSDEREGKMERYSTLEEAEKGHQKMCKEYEEFLKSKQ